MRKINDFPKVAMKSTVTYNITLTLANTYYCLCDATLVSTIAQYFTPDSVTGRITYDFTQDMICQFIGDTGIAVDKACRLTYCLFKNGVEQTCTSLDFVASAKNNSMGVNGICTLSEGDYIQVMAKSDTAGTVLTVDSLHISLS